MNILRESMTKVMIRPWVVRVWREEPDLAPEPDNDDIYIAAKEARETKYVTALSIALKLLQLDRVNAVEVIDERGTGEVLYKDWP